MANILKLPALSRNTKILSFDLESNGLHGEAFAVGAVVIDAQGNIHDEFRGRTDIIGTVDDWVAKHVLPVITDMDITHSSSKHLRDNFWSWFVRAQQHADYVLVQNGYPVEYRFLLQCQEDDMDSRYWQHPFPILDLTSLAVQAGRDIKELKHGVAVKHASLLAGKNHHPVYDAKITALMAFELLTGK